MSTGWWRFATGQWAFLSLVTQSAGIVKADIQDV
jgi:hypothetical protein